jgi:N-glycosidase YbiA
MLCISRVTLCAILLMGTYVHVALGAAVPVLPQWSMSWNNKANVERFDDSSPFSPVFIMPPNALIIEGRPFKSVEHFYQFKRIEGSDVAEQVAAEDDAALLEGLVNEELRLRRAREVRGWSDIFGYTNKRNVVMFSALKVKFSQNQALQDRLLRTGNKVLVYDSERFTWGAGREGFGSNMLGRMLMKIRTDLQQKSFKENDYYVYPWNTDVVNFPDTLGVRIQNGLRRLIKSRKSRLVHGVLVASALAVSAWAIMRVVRRAH